MSFICYATVCHLLTNLCTYRGLFMWPFPCEETLSPCASFLGNHLPFHRFQCQLMRILLFKISIAFSRAGCSFGFVLLVLLTFFWILCWGDNIPVPSSWGPLPPFAPSRNSNVLLFLFPCHNLRPLWWPRRKDNLVFWQYTKGTFCKNCN